MEDTLDAILIRAAEPEDAAGVSALIGGPGVVDGTLQVPDMPVASRLEMLARIEPRDCKLVAVAGGVIVGMCGLHTANASLRRAHVRLLGLAVAPQWQGRGLGRRLLERTIAWADGWGGVLRIELFVHADNPGAIALYRSLGFVEEGRHRAYALKDGRYVDSLSMARLHPRPPQLPAGGAPPLSTAGN